jgi:hypothetical protein
MNSKRDWDESTDTSWITDPYFSPLILMNISYGIYIEIE